MMRQFLIRIRNLLKLALLSMFYTVNIQAEEMSYLDPLPKDITEIGFESLLALDIYSIPSSDVEMYVETKPGVVSAITTKDICKNKDNYLKKHDLDSGFYKYVENLSCNTN